MNSIELLIVICISALTGIIYFFIGYFLAVKQKQDLINGVNFSKLSDPKEFIKVLGSSFLKSGIAIFACTFFLYVKLIGVLFYLMLFSISCLLPILVFVKAKKKYSL